MGQTALGAAKIAAKKAGISLDEYQQNVAAGGKWCYACRDWKTADDYISDRSRHDGKSALCRECRNRQYKARYKPKQGPRRHGPSPNAPRDGDYRQARQRVNVEVRTGRRPHPNDLPCADCGHVWREGERRHEYDHHLGYAAQHHYDVEPVCTTCHTDRHEDRGSRVRFRGTAGKYESEELVDG